MQDIEPYFNWRHLYTSDADRLSPFYGVEYNEFEYTQTLYNYYIHPQWDNFGSRTLYMKILFVEYEMGFVIIELIGEWNDAIENDIMTLRRNITDELFDNGIKKFIIIAENVLNFHSSDDSYYQDWHEQLEDENGWIVVLNMPEQSMHDFRKSKINYYVQFLELNQWRTYKPEMVFQLLDKEMTMRLD
jgi:hypothetical protein